MIMEKLAMVMSHSAYSACSRCSLRGEYRGGAVRSARVPSFNVRSRAMQFCAQLSTAGLLRLKDVVWLQR